MYEYTWYQWLTFFFIYCFFGWIFESTYVSAKKRRFVNRGFLRLPMLPLYGTGAVMMLWVSLPVKDNLFLVYVFGVVAATVLEYVTGWGMEKMFKMKYWDYSNQRFNVKGYICLTSSVAWGFLTIFLTEVIHRPIERYVLGLPLTVNIVCVVIISLLFAADAAESVKAALDLAKVLDAMTNMRAELDELQVQMALLKAETSQRMEVAREGAALKMEMVRSEAAIRASALKEDAADRLNELVENTVERMSDLMEDTAEKVEDLVEGTADRVARTAERLSGLTEDAAARVSEVWGQKLDAVGKSDTSAAHDNLEYQRAAKERREKLAALSRRLNALLENKHRITGRMDFYKRSILKGNPTASSSKFAEALKELREIVEKNKQ